MSWDTYGFRGTIEHHHIEKYLGDMDPADFDDENDVRDYFSERSLRGMFGEDIDMDEANAVADHIIRNYC